MADIRHTLSLDTGDLLDGLRKAADGLTGYESEMEDATDATAALGKGSTVAAAAVGVATVAVLAAAAAAVKLAGATRELAGEQNRYAKEAKKVGSSAEEIQKVEGAFDLLTDASLSAGRVIQDLGRNLADARDGTGEAKDELAKLGLAAEDLAGIPISEQIATIADRFGTLTDAEERSQVAMAVFGRAGRELVPALAAGGDAIRAAIGDIEGAGIASNESAAASEKLVDAFELMERQGDSLVRQVLEPLVPVLTRAATSAGEFIEVLRDTGVLQTFGRILAGIGGAAVAVTEALLGVGDAADDLERRAEEESPLVTRYNQQFEAANRAREAVEQLERELAASTSASQQARLTEDLAAARERLRIETLKLGAAEAGLELEMERAQRSADETARAEERAAAERARLAEAEERINESSADSKVRTEERKVAAIVKAREAAREAYQKAADERQKDNERQLREQAALEARLEASQAEHLRARIEAEREAARQREEVERTVASTIIDVTGQLAAGIIGALRDLNDARTEDAEERRDREIALAILMGEIQAGLAFASTLAQIGGTPAGYAAAAAAAAAVGVATKISAAAGAAQTANAFHDGGTIAPDEVNIRALAGEVVLSKPQVRSMGGPEGVERVVQGGGGPQEITVVQKLDHRVLDAQIARAVKRSGSPLDSALRRANPRATARRLPYSAVN